MSARSVKKPSTDSKAQTSMKETVRVLRVKSGIKGGGKIGSSTQRVRGG